jgi:chemotaxis protein CheX
MGHAQALGLRHARRKARRGGRFDRPFAHPYTETSVASEVFEVFLQALTQIFSETGIEIDAVEDGTRGGAVDQVAASVGIAGGVKGCFMLCADYSSARNIVHGMTAGIQLSFPPTGLGEIQRTALGEMTNQISGRAVTLLSHGGVECEISPPIIITAERLKSHLPGMLESFSRTVRGPFGSLRLLLAVSPPSHPEKQKTS